MKYKIETNGDCVWIHYHKEYRIIGMFNLIFSEIHLLNDSEFAKISYEETNINDWNKFVKAMKKYYGVIIDNKYIPIRFIKNLKNEIMINSPGTVSGIYYNNKKDNRMLCDFLKLKKEKCYGNQATERKVKRDRVSTPRFFK